MMCTLFLFWEAASCYGRRKKPCSYLMLVVVGYEWKIHSHIGCCKSLYGVSAPIQVTGCWLSPLGYTRWYLSIQGSHQSCWCNLLLHWSGHLGIFNQGHLWYLTYIFDWWRRFTFVDFWEGINFNQYRLLLQHQVWFLPQGLCWNCVCCKKTFIWIHQWWILSARLLVIMSGKIWVQNMGGHSIPWWRCSSWDCMMHIQHWPIFLFSSSITGLYHIFSLLSFSKCFYILFEFFFAENFLFPI